MPRIDPDTPILEDFFTVLSPEGLELTSVSALECFENSDYPLIWRSRPKPTGDIFHTNTLEILDGSLADRSDAFSKGNLLVSVLMLDTVAVIDPSTEAVVWAISGMWRLQHQPTVLPGGSMLVFDNKAGPGISRVLELDPITQEIIWTYEGTPEHPFHSETCGSNQRLGNGNTLITETDNGRAFEVTRDGETVWEYVNPHRAGRDGEFVASLFEVVRLRDGSEYDWLSGRR